MKRTRTPSARKKTRRRGTPLTAADRTSVQVPEGVPEGQADAEELVMQLMAIPGKSGEEGAVADFVCQHLRKAGAPTDAFAEDAAHRKTPIRGERGNLALRLPGTFKAPRRLLMAHMDTVPICVGSQPRRSGRTVRSMDPHTGLGADDRSGVAVILHTAIQLLRYRVPHPPLTFLWTVQEEIGLFGARYVRWSMLGNPRYAFNWDGGAATKLTIGATGGYRMHIEIEGLASHAGNAPQSGISAIAIAGIAIADLQRQGWHGAIRKRGRCGTTNIGVIHGGTATNVVTDRVVLHAEARSHDGAFRDEIVKQIETAFHKAVDAVRNDKGRKGSVTIEGRLDYDAFRLDEADTSVQLAATAVRACGGEPQLAITNGGLDANWMTKRGLPTVSLGCGQKNPHTTSEALDLGEFRQACKIAWRLATAAEGEA